MISYIAESFFLIIYHSTINFVYDRELCGLTTVQNE